MTQVDSASCAGQSLDTGFLLCLGSVFCPLPLSSKFCALNPRWISKEGKNLTTMAIVHLASEADNTPSRVRGYQKERANWDGKEKGISIYVMPAVGPETVFGAFCTFYFISSFFVMAGQGRYLTYFFDVILFFFLDSKIKVNIMSILLMRKLGFREMLIISLGSDSWHPGI